MPDKKTVLIIDDDTFLLDMYSLKFSEKGFAVHTAGNAEEALTLLKEKGVSPDVVLLDLVMPTIDGFGLLERIREKKLCPAAAMIVFSNLGEPSDIDRAKALGIDDFIVKASVTPSEAVEKVLEVMDKKTD